MGKLARPYPFHHRGAELLQIAGLLLIVGFVFEMLIVPFPRTPSEHLYPYWIITLFHVGVAGSTYLLYFFLIGLFGGGKEWKLSKELVAVCGLLLMIGLGEWSIRPIIYSTDSFSLKYVWEEIWHAYLSGGLIYLLVMLIKVNLLPGNGQSSASISQAGGSENEKAHIQIKAQITSDDFLLFPSDLVCALSEGNYIRLYLMNEEAAKVNGGLIRMTLQSFCDQLQLFDFIVRTHRGYVVNTNRIAKINGNAQGYQLSLAGLDFQVPVSRTYLNAIDRLKK